MEKNIIQYSGGKDSTALLYYMKDQLDTLDVVFVETGATFPHVVQFIRDTCDKLKANLIVIRPIMDVDSYTLQYGLPSDLVPVERTFEMAGFLQNKPEQLLQSYMTCCGQMIYKPMADYISDNEIQLVYRGSKRSDVRVGVGPSYKENGVTYISPLWEWSDKDVYTFLSDNGIMLPEHYKEINDSIDCWLCTAHFKHYGDKKMRYIKRAYPDLWIKLQGRANQMAKALRQELESISPALKELNDG